MKFPATPTAAGEHSVQNTVLYAQYLCSNSWRRYIVDIQRTVHRDIFL